MFSMFYMTKAAVPHMRHGSAIINTTSVTAYRGIRRLVDLLRNEGSNRFLHTVPFYSQVAPSYVFLASNGSSFMTGQVLHPNGGEIINT